MWFVTSVVGGGTTMPDPMRRRPSRALAIAIAGAALLAGWAITKKFAEKFFEIFTTAKGIRSLALSRPLTRAEGSWWHMASSFTFATTAATPTF